VAQSGNTVSPSGGSGTAAQLNSVLAGGVTYTTDQTVPDSDQITVAVEDGNGVRDSVHFVFNVANGGPNISLTGTTGKDVIFATGYSDTLTGNTGADLFHFKTFGRSDTITDFNVFQDGVNIDSAVFNSVADMLANHTTDDGSGNAVIADGSGASITFRHVSAATLQAHANDFHLL